MSVPGRPQGTLIHKDQMRRVGSDILNKDDKPKDGLQSQIMNDKIPSCPHSPVQKSNTHAKILEFHKLLEKMMVAMWEKQMTLVMW